MGFSFLLCFYFISIYLILYPAANCSLLDFYLSLYPVMFYTLLLG